MSTIGNGVNLQPSYASGKSGNVSFGWELMKSLRYIRTVRIEIEPDRATQARSWIQQACGKGYEVIATYHKFKDKQTGKKLLGTDKVSELMLAANWWKNNFRNLRTGAASYTVQADDTLSAIAQLYYGDASKYHGIFQANKWLLTSPHLIHPGQTLTIPAQSRSFKINLMNEWGSHSLTAQQYAEAYNSAIGIVRKVYNGPLIIDVPGFAQETYVAASAVKGVTTSGGGRVKITDPHVILSVHIYRDAYVKQKRPSSPERSGPLDQADLDDLATAGRPCMVGEFGPGEEAGPADWEGLVAHAKSLVPPWPVLAWAWNGDGGTMNMVTPAWSSNPNASSYGQNTSYFGKVYHKLK